VVDASQALGSEDSELIGQVARRPAIVVENKADIASSQFFVPGSQVPRVRTSAITGAGIVDLRAQILRHVGGETGAQVESGFLTSARHRGLVRDSLAALDAARVAAENHVPHEMLLLDLYNALRPLDEITGATTTDDIMNLIFSTFCIGK